MNTDQLMQLTSLESEEVASALKQLEEMGLLVNDSQITLYVRHGVTGASSQRLSSSLELEGLCCNACQSRHRTPSMAIGRI